MSRERKEKKKTEKRQRVYKLYYDRRDFIFGIELKYLLKIVQSNAPTHGCTRRRPTEGVGPLVFCFQNTQGVFHVKCFSFSSVKGL